MKFFGPGDLGAPDRYDLIVIGPQFSASINPLHELSLAIERLSSEGIVIGHIPNSMRKEAVISRLIGTQKIDPGMNKDQVDALIHCAGLEPIYPNSPPLPSAESPEHPTLVRIYSEIMNLTEAEISDLMNTFAWTVRARPLGSIRRPTLRLRVLSLRPQAAVTEARVDYPLKVLNSRPDVDATWSSSEISVPANLAPGIIIYHRRSIIEESAQNKLVEKIGQGWTVVVDFDDDPHHFEVHRASDFVTFRFAHAVTVSTPNLRKQVQAWNPHVFVLPNQMFEIKPLSKSSMDITRPMRVFFGALNREPDWSQIAPSIFAAAKSSARPIEFVVLHDRAVFESIHDGLIKQFIPLQDHENYLKILRTCDVALMPLGDNQFNRCKSDLKLIEACACGAVPICSDLVYGDDPRHFEFAVFPKEADRWGQALTQLACDPKELQRRRVAGWEYVKEHRMHSSAASDREKLYRELVERHAELEADRASRMLLFRQNK